MNKDQKAPGLENSPGKGGLPGSVVSALVILAAVVFYFSIGTVFFRSDNTASEAAADMRPSFTVLVRSVSAEPFQTTVSVRGRTEAGRRVTVRSETPGQVASLPVTEGSAVKKGDVLCRLDFDSRRAVLEEAQAAFTKADSDFTGTKRLHEEGFASDAALRTARAARDAASARLAQARLDYSNVEVVAPFDGILSELLVEPGDVLSAGGPCAIVADLSEIVIAGGVNAAEAKRISVGDTATIALGSGDQMKAVVSYVADVADDRTRAFRVELSTQNSEDIPAGISAEATVFANRSPAAVLPRNALVFDDNGVLGVRTLNPSDSATGIVEFRAVELAGESEDGVFITGLPSNTNVIIRGQDFVRAGSNVAYAVSPDEQGG